jgi:hypothetical protein
MQSLSWYVHRLGRMSPAELAYRVGQVARATQERLTNAHEAPVPEPVRPREQTTFIFAPPDLDPEPYIREAQRIMQGRMAIFTLEDAEVGNPPQWNRDPLTGKVAPLQLASTLDYRDERLVGNIKYLWEPNRHLHLPTLAQAYALTRDPAYAATIRRHLDSWMEQCPPGRGANWTSSLELGIRLINWSITWQLIGGYDAPLFEGSSGEGFRRRWLESIYRHVRAVMRKLSRFSSANNHLIGETAGVVVASATWPYWPQVQAWGRRARAILEREVLLQNAEDGGNKEQAFSYQQFVLDFALVAALAARAGGEPFSARYRERMERMIEFLAAMMDAGGHMPMIGDADDGYVMTLAPPLKAFDNYRSLLATGAILFERSDFARKAEVLDKKTLWLLGADARASFDRLLAGSPSEQLPRAFPQSGYYILGSDFDTSSEIRLLVDAGPLGYLSIAAHGHADALSVVLSVGGREILIDPGTYAYHTEPEWRRYFRGTRAHNTVLVDGVDQSLQSGNFMWSRHAEARCLRFERREGEQRFIGEHDGYRALREPLLHRREIVYDERRCLFTITDKLEGRGEHEVSLPWHFAESCAPEIEGAQASVRTDAHRIRLVPDTTVERVDVYRGGSPTQGGWVSRSFGRKEPTTTLVWNARMKDAMVFRTFIYVEKP